MGVRGLLTYCYSIQTRSDGNPTGKTVGVDGFSLFFLFQEERAAFEEYMRDLCGRAGQVKVILDRRAAKEKRDVLQGRREQRAEAKEIADDLQVFANSPEFADMDQAARTVLEKELAQKQRASWCVYPDYWKWAAAMMEACGASVVWAVEEADDELGRGGYDIVISCDSDLLLHSIKCLWIPRRSGTAAKIQYREILGHRFRRLVSLDQDRLYELAFLAGCDVQPKSYMSVQQAVSRLRFYGSLEGISQKHPELVSREDVQKFEILRDSVWRKPLPLSCC